MSAPARKYWAWISSIAFGCVRIRRSLLPRRSRWKSLKRSPRNAASSYSRPWIMVPMAPSSTRMRSRAAEIRAVHGVEVKGVDAVLGELLHLTGRDGGGDQLAGLGVVVEAFEFFRQPV